MCQKNDYTRRAVTVLLAVLTALVVVGATLTNAQIAQGGNYRLEQAVVAAGGGASTDATGGVYGLVSTVGEPIAGTTSVGTGFAVKGGFLAAVAPRVPTAAPVFIEGRVLTSAGNGLINALVTLTDSSGASRTALTRRSGAFRFDDVNAGETYFISVRSKRYTFQPQVLSVLENAPELIFVAQ